MFKRVNEFFIVTTNNLAALESITEWIYKMLKSTYFIQIELFQNMTVYHVCIPIRIDLDKKVEKQMKNFLEIKHQKLLKEES